MTSVLFLSESGSKGLNGLPAAEAVSPLMTAMVGEGLAAVAQVEEADQVEAVDVTFLISARETICKHHKNINNY